MTRRAFIRNLGLAAAALGVPVAAAKATQLEPCLFAALDPAFGHDTYCWADQTHDGLFITGGTKLQISDPLSGRTVIFDDYRMAEIPQLCEVVRAMRG